MSRIQIALGRMRATSRAVPAANPGFSAEVPFFGGPIGDDELSEFDPKGTLPEDYLEFLRSHRRIIAIDVWNGYAFLSPLQAFGQELHLQLLNVVESVSGLAVASDGSGNTFFMGRSENARGVIWKHNHEFPPVPPGNIINPGLTQVAETFTDFLERVADDWEHAVAGNREWTYLSG